MVEQVEQFYDQIKLKKKYQELPKVIVAIRRERVNQNTFFTTRVACCIDAVVEQKSTWVSNPESLPTGWAIIDKYKYNNDNDAGTQTLLAMPLR